MPLAGTSQEKREFSARTVWGCKPSSAAARFGEKRREAEGRGGGVFLFSYFILDKKNKVTRLEAKKVFI